MAETFRALINQLIARAGSATAVASAINMSISAFTRSVNNRGSLGVSACLRLAKWSGENPVMVLRLAGKGDVADLIQEMFGPERAIQSEPERELLALWRQKHPEAQTALFTLLRALPDSARKPLRRHA